MYSLFHIGVLLSFSIILRQSSADRKLNSTYNPQCDKSAHGCDQFGTSDPFYNNLLYTISNDPNNSDANDFRIFFSSIGAPTFLITQVPKNTSAPIPDISWEGFIDDNHPTMSFLTLWNSSRYSALVISKLIEFEDSNDSAQLEQATNFTVHDLSFTQWYKIEIVPSTSGGDLLGTFTGIYSADNNITLEVRAHVGDSRADNPPRMLVQPNSISVRIILNNQTTQWEKSRFALELIFASNDSSNAVATHSEQKAISDEYSPGVFTLEKISGEDTFMEWKPIVYTKVQPGVGDSTRSKTGSLVNITTAFPKNATNDSLPYSLLQGLQNVVAPGATLVKFNLTLGISRDDFYASSFYQEWNCELGIGRPRIDTTSSNVHLIIAVGFGVPAVLILFGGIYVIYIKMKRRRMAGSLIQETTTTYQSLG